MRSPWASFTTSVIGLVVYLPFAALWMLPVISRPTDGIIVHDPLVFFVPAALGIALSLFGLSVGTRHAKSSLQPRWPITVGIMVGFLDTVIWVGSVGIIVLKMLSVYVYVY